jgi:ADP-ribose pyrophosphatase
MSDRQNPWKTVQQKNVYENSWIRIEHHDVINPQGKPGIYGKVCFKSRAVGIIPVDEHGYTWLVGQYRYTLHKWLWEIPMGGAPLHEDTQQAAHRELREETGLRAGNMQPIMFLHTSKSVTDEEGCVYLATDLVAGDTEFEETEQIEIVHLPLREAIAMAQDGRITDIISIAGLLHLALNAGRYGLEL